MTIDYRIQARKQRYLISAFAIIMLTAILVWGGYFVFQGGEEIQKKPVLKPVKKVEIDFKILENPLLEGLQLIEKSTTTELKIGRENPFSPF